jgi:hypothetical protein
MVTKKTTSATKKPVRKPKGDDFLARQNEAMMQENRELRDKLKEKEESYRRVEILNVSLSSVDFPELSGDKTKRLTPYGTPHCRAIVAERDWIHLYEQGFLAIDLGEIRVEKYITPDDLEVPEEWRHNAYSPDDVKELLKLKPKPFKDFIDGIDIPEILYRFWIVADDLNFIISTEEDSDEANNYPYLLSHANYLFSKYSRLKMKINEIPTRQPYDREVDVISFTQADRIRQNIKNGKFNTGR